MERNSGLKALHFWLGSMLIVYEEFAVKIDNGVLDIQPGKEREYPSPAELREAAKKQTDGADSLFRKVDDPVEALNSFHFDAWKQEYCRENTTMQDGILWRIEYQYESCEPKIIRGNSNFPNEWYRLKGLLERIYLQSIMRFADRWELFGTFDDDAVCAFRAGKGKFLFIEATTGDMWVGWNYSQTADWLYSELERKSDCPTLAAAKKALENLSPEKEKELIGGLAEYDRQLQENPGPMLEIIEAEEKVLESPII